MPTESLTIDQAATWLTRSDQEWGTTTVTYSFATSVPSNPAFDVENFQAFGASQQAAVELAFELWSDVCGLTFVEADPGEEGDIQFYAGDLYLLGSGEPAPAGAAADYPNEAFCHVAFNTLFDDFYQMGVGEVGFYTVLHEIGHALGLSHPGNYDAGQGTITYEDHAEYIQDTRQYTVMSYFSETYSGAAFNGSIPLSPLLHDIAAVEQMYGDNPETRTGNTTYGFNSNSDRIIHRFDDVVFDSYGAATEIRDIAVFTIYDSGGIDTIDLSGYGTHEAQRLDLNQMAFSDIGGMTNNISIARYTEIENAIGGAGHDEIEGNELGNNIQGNDGDDTIDGNGGSDFINGGDGEDWIDGGDDPDYLFGGAQGDHISGGSGNDHIFGEAGVDFLYGNEGSDEIFGGSEGDYIYGGDQDETPYGATILQELSAGAGNGDFLYGEDGNDQIYGGYGADLLRGGNGDDYLQGGWGQDAYYGGAGSDTVSFTYASLGWLVYLDNDGQGNGEASLFDAPAFTEVLSSIENADMGSGDDEVWGSNGANVIWGNDGDDLLIGLGGDDEIYGGMGDDDIYGNNQNDDLFGHWGNDTINGGSGNDFIDGGDDDDTLDGSTGNDTILGGEGDDDILGGSGGDTINGNEGRDTIDGGSGADVIFGDEGADVLVGGSGEDTIHGGDHADVIHGGDDADSLYGDGGNDTINGGSGGDYAYGGVGNDTINGHSGADALNGGEGDDLLSGDGENDHLMGGWGDDTVSGDNGDDVISWGPGTALRNGQNGPEHDGLDHYDGGAGIDLVTYEGTQNGVTVDLSAVSDHATGAEIGVDQIENVENVYGGHGDDTITGDGNANVIAGLAGDDVLADGGGVDEVYGGFGDDLVIASTGDDDDYYDGGTGEDTLSYQNALLGVTAMLVASPDNPLGPAAWSFEVGFNTIVGFENLTGGAGSDHLRGDALANVLSGGSGGDDLLEGGGGADILWGGSGEDTLAGGDGGDVLNGGTGLDTASYADSNARVVVNLGLNYAANGHAAGDSFNSIERVIGSDFNDRIVGTAGGNRLWGGDGDDELNGGGGNDLLFGENGDDLLIGGGGNDTLTGGPGADTLQGGIGADTASYEGSDDRVVINLGLNYAASGHAAGDSFVSIERVIGSDFNDRIVGTSGANVLRGGDGPDELNGAGGNDELFGENGNDILIGGAGGDLLDGGAGIDTASYEDSNARVVINLGLDYAASGHAAGDSFVSIERVIGSAYNDRIVADANDNRLWGGNGNDELNGGDGSDQLFGENGNDILIGGAGGDLLDGGAGVDTASYEGSDDRVVINLGLNYAASGHAAGDSFVSIERVIGSAYNDRIVGDAGENALWGGAGNDELTGGAGDDLLFGEGGADLFVFNAGDGDDEIGDFLVGTDFLVLNGIDIDDLSELDGNGDAVMDTLVAFSSGDSVLLASVTGVLDAGDLIA